MSYNLRNRSFLKEIDFTPAELRHLLRLAEALKLAKYAGTEQRRLEGKEIALIFEKTSTRTGRPSRSRHSTSAHVTYLDPTGPSLATRSRSRTPQRCSDGCMTRSSSGATPKARSRRSRSMRAYRSTTD